jgi:hypothetical protein
LYFKLQKTSQLAGRKGLIWISMKKIFGGSLFLARYRNDCPRTYLQKLCQSFDLRRKCNVEESSNCGNRFRIEQKAYFFQNIKSNGLLCRYININHAKITARHTDFFGNQATKLPVRG